MKSPFLVGMAFGVIVPTFGMILNLRRNDARGWFLVAVYVTLAVVAGVLSLVAP